MATGRLFVVATPIGNLDDISPRALRVLASVALVAAEDTRHSKRLLDHFNIRTPLTSYHDHNESEKARQLLDALADGKDVALITDAGTPCIADPGYRIVRAANELGVAVESVPGPSAVVAALAVSGLPTDRFAFHGFFRRKRKDAVEVLEQAGAFGGTHVFYEAPNRLCDALALIGEVAPGAELCVARELTKIHEEVVRGTPTEVLDHFAAQVPKGECVIMVYFAQRAKAEPSDDEIREAVERAMTEGGLSRRDAVRDVAVALGIARNRVYDAAGRG